MRERWRMAPLLVLVLLAVIFFTKEAKAAESAYQQERVVRPQMLVTGSLSNKTPVYAVEGGKVPSWQIKALEEAGISSSMSEYDICLRLYGYIGETLAPAGRTVGPEAALAAGEGSPADYSALFQELAKAMDIDCYVAVGIAPGRGGSWNMVITQNQIYGVDSYYGDTSGKNCAMMEGHRMEGYTLRNTKSYATRYTARAETAVTERVIYVGDSRMKAASTQSPALRGEVFIAESGQGLAWYRETAREQLMESLTADCAVLTNLGVNDTGNIEGYLSEYEKLIKAHPGIRLYVASVNPVGPGYRLGSTTYESMTDSIQDFNQALREFAQANENVFYVDTYDFVQERLETKDNLHYTRNLNQQILSLWREAVYGGRLPQ